MRILGLSNPEIYRFPLCSALCCEMKWMNLRQLWILAFACLVALNCQHTSQNSFYGCEKIKPDPNFVMTDESFGGSV